MSFNHNPSFFSSSTTEKLTENQTLIKSKFESICLSLENRIEKGDLNKHDLLDIYINGINHNEYIPYAGTECETHNFFADIIDKRKNKLIGSYDEYVIAELVHAIARGVCIGYINSEILHSNEHIELAPFSQRF